MLMLGFFGNDSSQPVFMPVSLALYGSAKINMAARRGGHQSEHEVIYRMKGELTQYCQ